MNKVLLFFVLLISSPVLAQPKAEQALQKLYKEYPQEKVFLLFNKNDFVAGETVHFRSYVFSGYTLSSISTNLYVELYNQNKKLLDKLLLPLGEGVGEGSFTLPADLPDGIYHIRAYTKWMLNFDPTFQSINSFPVYNMSSAEQVSLKPVQWNAAAFPESGTMLAGVESQIAVRLFGNIEAIQNWNGYLVESSMPENRLADFFSFNNEVGSFRFTPKENASYEVVITDNLGNTKRIALPPVQTKGALLKAVQTENKLVCVIRLKNKGSEKYKLIAQMQDQLIYSGKVSASDSVFTATIPVDSLENGIVQLTLFNEREQPVAERLVFVKVREHSTASIKFDTLSLKARGYNHWLLNADTLEKYSYTVSISDPAIVPRENILSALYLTGDLGRNINNPAWYFDHRNKNTEEALDALMITEKWKRFNWGQVLRGIFPVKKFLPDQYLSFIGTAFIGRRIQTHREVNLIIYNTDSTYEIHNVKTDSSGSFVVDDLIFSDSARIFYQLNNKKIGIAPMKVLFEENNRFEKYELPLPQSYYQLIPRKPDAPIPALVQHSINTLQNEKKIALKEKKLETVFVRTKKRRLTEDLNKKLSSPGFRSFDETVFDFVNDDEPLTNQDILSWLRGRVAGLQGGTNGLSSRGSPVNIYIDEMRADASFASSLSIFEIAMVKFTQMGGGLVQGPALLIYTKRGDKRMPFLGLPYVIVKGYQKPKPFLQINYKEEIFNSLSNDTRPVLLWHTFSTNKRNEKPSIKFYHNDNGGAIRVMITGISKEGFPVYFEKVILP